MTHELKTWTPHFDAVISGLKTFEMRKADREFSTGDILRLQEWIPSGLSYTGRAVEVLVTYILPDGPFSPPGYSVMSISLMKGRPSLPVPPDGHPGLTPREREIVLLIRGRMSQKQVSAQLGISERTVKNHLSNARKAAGGVSK